MKRMFNARTIIAQHLPLVFVGSIMVPSYGSRASSDPLIVPAKLRHFNDFLRIWNVHHLDDLLIMNFIWRVPSACYLDCGMIQVLRLPLCKDLLII